MTIGINDLRKAIELGSDIEFRYKDREYTILPWTDEGIVIGPQDVDEEMVYETAEELINNYKMNGKVISQVIEEIEILLI